MPISSVSRPVPTDLVARLHAHRVTTEEQLYAINGVPSDRIRDKDTNYLTPLMEQFVAAAPFFLIATSDNDGDCDVSPKGDPAGLVKLLDSRTIAIPSLAAIMNEQKNFPPPDESQGKRQEEYRKILY